MSAVQMGLGVWGCLEWRSLPLDPLTCGPCAPSEPLMTGHTCLGGWVRAGWFSREKLTGRQLARHEVLDVTATCTGAVLSICYRGGSCKVCLPLLGPGQRTGLQQSELSPRTRRGCCSAGADGARGGAGRLVLPSADSTRAACSSTVVGPSAPLEVQEASSLGSAVPSEATPGSLGRAQLAVSQPQHHRAERGRGDA